MAEEEERDEEDNGEEGEGGKAKGKKGLIIILAIVLLLLAGGGGAAYFFLMGDKDKAESSEEAASDEEETSEEASAEDEEGDTEEGEEGEEGKAKAPAGPVYYEMPEFLVNLSSNNGKPSFLKMKVTLELKSKKDIPVIESYMPRITDNFNTYLRELRSSDLSGSAGIYRLREELLMRINQFTAPTRVENVLFKDIVVQ